MSAIENEMSIEQQLIKDYLENKNKGLKIIGSSIVISDNFSTSTGVKYDRIEDGVVNTYEVYINRIRLSAFIYDRTMRRLNAIEANINKIMNGMDGK